jgi:hypothetical protein
MIAVCGVICSDCPAYHARSKGLAYQKRTAAAWHRIYGLNEKPENISCGGCLGSDADLFHTSRRCRARRCCRRHEFTTCADCAIQPCTALEHAQCLWDGVPALVSLLSRADFVAYARPYCGHRKRIAAARRRRGKHAVAG